MSNPFEPYDFAKIRLFVDAQLAAGADVALAEGQLHYLRNVMRQSVGDTILVFNGREGEWTASISDLGKKTGMLAINGRSRVQDTVPDLELIFAPVKRLSLDFLVQKATELGVASLRPVITERTNVARVNTARLRANVIEAAEQSGRMTIPMINNPIKLEEALRSWEAGRRLIFCDEAREAPPMVKVLANAGPSDDWSIIIGPEGGFSERERSQILSLEATLPVSLGPRIMRADTAALAAVTLWQSALGDL